MPRTFSFVLNNADQWYNLWRDFIAPTITDPTFSNSPYIPSTVSELEIQNKTGSNMRVSDNKLNGGLLITGSLLQRSSLNSIDLKNINFIVDASTAVNISIIAR